MSKPNLNWSNLSDDEFIVEVQKIADDLANNPNFPELKTEAAEIKVLGADLTVAVAKAKKGSVLDTSVKNDKRKFLEDKLYYLGLKVDDASKGDASKILSSGYTLKVEHHVPAGILPVPTDINIIAGPTSGSLLISWKRILHANSYSVRYREVGSNNWITLFVTKRKILIEGLIPGKEYEFSIAGVGSHPTHTWSAEKKSFVM